MIGPKRSIHYFLVAASCLVIHNVVMIGSDALAVNLPFSVVASFLAVGLFGYVLHSRLTFAAPMSWAALGRYGLGMSLNIPLAFVTIWFWKETLGLPMWIASPVATVCMLALNYAISRWAIVRPVSVTE